MTPKPIPSKFNPWPVAIVLYFIVFIATAAGFIVFACGQRMDLVRPDYYDQDIRYQEQIDCRNRTRPFEAQIDVIVDRARREIVVRIPPIHAAGNATGQILLYRPSDAGRDQQVNLAVNPDGEQRIGASQLAAGLWRVKVAWQVDAVTYCMERNIVVAN